MNTLSHTRHQSTRATRSASKHPPPKLTVRMVRLQFARRIRELRKKARMKQRELGAHIGVKQACVAGYENGRIVPRFHEVPFICSALNCDPNCLFGNPSYDHAATLYTLVNDRDSSLCYLLAQSAAEIWATVEELQWFGTGHSRRTLRSRGWVARPVRVRVLKQAR